MTLYCQTCHLSSTGASETLHTATNNASLTVKFEKLNDETQNLEESDDYGDDDDGGEEDENDDDNDDNENTLSDNVLETKRKVKHKFNFICPFCDARMTRLIEHKNHMETHLDRLAVVKNNRYKCRHCPKTLLNLIILHKHIRLQVSALWGMGAVYMSGFFK
jgi:hypothetical protein